MHNVSETFPTVFVRHFFACRVNITMLILMNFVLISHTFELLQGNGYINVSDLRDILRALDDNITEDELDEMIAEIDTDGSGTVDFDGNFLCNLTILQYNAMHLLFFRVHGNDERRRLKKILFVMIFTIS